MFSPLLSSWITEINLGFFFRFASYSERIFESLFWLRYFCCRILWRSFSVSFWHSILKDVKKDGCVRDFTFEPCLLISYFQSLFFLKSFKLPYSSPTYSLIFKSTFPYSFQSIFSLSSSLPSPSYTIDSSFYFLLINLSSNSSSSLGLLDNYISPAASCLYCYLQLLIILAGNNFGIFKIRIF